MRIRILVALVVFGFASVGLAASNQTRGKRVKSIPDGTWGTQHMRVQVENGTATIEYDCAHGTISGPLKIDSRGRFSLAGTHEREHGGPIRTGFKVPPQSARYTGWTDGRKMTLTVTLVDTKETLGTYTLVRGQEGRVWKCK